METANKKHLDDGKIIAAAIIITDIILHLVGISKEIWYLAIENAVLFSLILFFSFAKGETLFSEIVGKGFKTAAVATCLYFVYSVLSLNFIFKEFVHNMLAHTLPSGKLENVEMEMKIIKTSYLSMLVIVNLGVGLLASILGAAVQSFFNQKKQKSN